MAYSDYGGYAYRNGIRMDDRSDAVLSPDGIKSTPGAWPGWTIPEGRMGGSYHVLMGDGPVFFALYKQSTTHLFRLGDELVAPDYLSDPEPGAVSEFEWRGETKRYLNADHFKALGEPAILKVDGHKIEIVYREEDNSYVYARLTQPDGTVWTGFSGYGVGAGLEDCGYGFSTSDRVDTLSEVFPQPPSIVERRG